MSSSLQQGPRPTLEIVIPVLDEERSLERNVLRAHDYLTREFGHRVGWSIVIAENGSTDATCPIAERLAAEHAGIGFLTVGQRGVGRALKRAWTESRADLVGYMDLDLATELCHVREAYDLLRAGAALVYGSRLHRNSRVIGRSLNRELSSRAFNLIAHHYFGTGFSDGMCGFKFLRREILDDLIALGADNDGWFFSTELLVTAEWAGYDIRELPVCWTDSSDSKVRQVSLALRYLRAMRRLKRRRRPS